MADTITVTTRIQYTPDATSTRLAIDTGELEKTITLSGTQVQVGSMSLTTTEAALDLGGMTADTEGYVLIRNTGTTNNATVGQSGTAGSIHPVMIKPGESVCFRVNTTPASSALTVCSAASTTTIQYYVFSN